MMMIVHIVLLMKWQKPKTNDPIITFGAYLKEVGIMDDALEKEINDRIMKQVNEATDYAENAPYADAESALKYVYAEEQ